MGVRKAVREVCVRLFACLCQPRGRTVDVCVTVLGVEMIWCRVVVCRTGGARTGKGACGKAAASGAEMQVVG